MPQWVLALLALLVASLCHGAGAAKEGDGAAAHLYSVASSRQQRAQLPAGAALLLRDEPVEVVAPLLVAGVAGKPATITCSKDGPQAFIVRGTTLQLQHVVITGCSKQAIVLKGPGAVLKANSVTFRSNGPTEAATASAARSQPLGQVIAAEEATVELTNVTFAGNNGVRFARTAAVPLWRPFLHPACKDDSVTGGITGRGDDDSATPDREFSTDPRLAKQQACGSPLLVSSLIDLEQSTLVLRGCKLQDNHADALITARGSSAQSLQLLAETVFEGNRGRWLIVADSWTHDPVGRKNLMAPQPSEAVKGLDMEPPYTSYALMGNLRSPTSREDGGAGGRKLLQQQQGQPPPQQRQQDAQAQGRPVQQQGQQPRQEMAQFDPHLQQPDNQHEQQEQVSPDAAVGTAPKGQVPLQVRFQGVTISHNVVQSGVLWSRLVNTSMQDTDVLYNIGTGGRSSVVRQMHAVLAKLPAAVAEAGQRALANDSEPASLAAQVAAAGSIVPPGPCDVGSLQRSLLIMHGPSAFDMLRCRVSHNVHFSGAVLRVTDGLGPTSLRNSMLVNNTATAVLRFEGRTWVLKTDTFFAGIQFLDVLFYTQFQGASQAAYKFAELQHTQQQASKDKVSYDAFWFMSNTSMVNNTVFHSLVMSKGSRTSWRSFLAQKADILQSGGDDAANKAKNLPLINLSTSWWMRGCTLEGNRLQLPAGSTTNIVTSNTGPFSSKAGSPVRSGDRAGSQGQGGSSSTQAGGSNSTTSRRGDAGAAMKAAPYPNEWIEAVPYAAYSDVLSAVLDADESLLSKLSQGGDACHGGLRKAVDEQQEQLTLQVMLRASAPAVLWASTTQGYIEQSNITSNGGFFHTLRMDNAYVTWKEVGLFNNTAAFSVFDLWFGDAWIEQADVLDNHVQSGSIWNFESFRGRFNNIKHEGNKAGSARPSDLAGIMLNDANCKKKPPKPPNRQHPVLRSTPSSASTPSSDTPTTGSGATLSPIWRMSHFLGELHNMTMRNNTGSIALDISGMALSAPLSGLLVEGNNASGIRLLLPEPKYDNQSIVLSDVWVMGNSLSPAAPLVGGLLLGGFTSGVGATMPVAITNCRFIDNIPVQPADTLTLQGGGVCIQGPAADSSDDPMSQHGFLQKLSIMMTKTEVSGNVAAEGGGLWTAWPMIIEDCAFHNNHAVVSGGGIYSKGLQQDSLGAFGALIINHTSIINNTASFGGGIACDSCRAILAAQIDSNKAIRNVSLDNSPTPSSVLWAAGSGSNGGSSGGCRNGTSSGSSLNPARRLRHAVLGAGGGIAANLAGNSYVVVCVSGNGTSLDDRGRSTLRHNTAQALGGAVYLNSTQIAADCPFPQPGPALTETCFPGGWWPKKCGFNTLDLDWQGSLASAGGDLVAWAGDTSGFNMACTLTGAACSNSTLQEAGNATSGRAGGRHTSIGRVNEQGVWVKQGASGGDGRNSTGGPSGAQQTCVRTFDAQAPYVCVAGSGLAGKNVMLVDETRKFQLPASFYVYNTTCIQETSNFSRSWQACAVAGDIPHEIPRVFSGDTMNLTVSLGTTQQRLHPSTQDAVIGIVQLQQPPDGSLFVIGDIRQQMQMGLATFSNMALQPVTPPISNREYEFRFVPAWGAGNDLLRQVKHVSVNVLLLRCTLGMHMTINRCVRCSANGTYSLNPFTNETIGCQPCPNGGLCQNGLLAPRIGYFSYNPFVPQILPCPLKGACTGGRRAEWGLSPAILKELQRQSLAVPGSPARPHPPGPNAWQDAWDWGNPVSGRHLLAAGDAGSLAPLGGSAGAEGAEGADKQRRSSLLPRQHRVPDSHELQDGTDAEGDAQQRAAQQQPVVVSRRATLMGYNKLLAQLWANDSTDGMPLLMGVEFSELLDAWHRLQCNPGYTGLFCGRCDLNYVDPMLLAADKAAGPLGAPDRQGDRYGLHMGSCVRCQSPAVIGLALFGLFLLLFAYNAFGMCMQLRNSGIRDPYLRFVRTLAAQQAQQQSGSGGQLQPQGNGWTGLTQNGSSGTLARASSSSSQASQSQGQSQHPQASQHGNSSQNASGANSQQPSLVGNCYSVNTVLTTQISYGFAVPFGAVGGGGPPGLPVHASVLHPGMSQQLSQQMLVRTSTISSPFQAQRQGSTPAAGASSLQQQGSSAGPLSPMGSLGSPFLQQAHLPPLPPVHSGQQYPRQQQQAPPPHHPYQQQQSMPASPMHGGQGQQRASLGGSPSSWDAGGPGYTATPSSGLPRANTMPHSVAGQAQAAAHAGTSGDPITAAEGGAAGGAAAGGTGLGASSSTASPQAGPAAAAAGSFLFTSQQDQQQPRDQHRQASSPHQGQWWGTGTAVSGATPPRQQSLPPPGPQQQHFNVLPPLPQPHPHPQQSMQPVGSVRHRHQSSILTSLSSSQQVQSAGQGSNGGRGVGGASAPGNGGSSNPSRRSSNSSRGGSSGQQQQPQPQQQRQQQGFRKGPAALLVGLWKVLTSYLQVLGTIRHISLRALPEMSAQALAWADLSTFTSFVALDCLLPGPQEWHAFIKLFARTIALPLLLLLASALMWTTCWLFRHLALRLHRKYGHRHNLRWQPLRQMQRHARVAPDPLKAYLSPRMLITLVVLSYSLYPLVTSGLLYTLQCVYIPGPFAAESAAVEYSRGHYDWLLQRQAAANRTAVPAAVAMSSAFGSSTGQSDIQLCRPGQGALGAGLCWVTGRFWAMDYDVQCFVGHHRAVAYFGLVMLLLVGVCFPVAAALLLWCNRKRLDEWDFAWKWSFLYAEYNQNTCFWEFIIMGRKLAFLAATILLPMALDTPEETTAQMQLLVCVLLAVTFLLLHASLHPFKRGVLNRLERLGLTAIALSCTLLAASLVVEKGRAALLVILGLVNVTVVAIFLYHIIRQLWLWIGAPASKAVGTAYRNSRDWWGKEVSSRVKPYLERWAACWQWPPVCLQRVGGTWAGRSLARVKGWCWWRGSERKQEEEEDKDHHQQQQQVVANGCSPPAVPPPPPQQQQQRKQKAQGQQAAADGHIPQPPPDQQQQHVANGHVPQQANGHVQPQANGHVHANGCAPPAVQQQQQQQQQPTAGQGSVGPPEHNMHQIQLTRR